jgi:hypothetical protein
MLSNNVILAFNGYDMLKFIDYVSDPFVNSVCATKYKKQHSFEFESTKESNLCECMYVHV